MNIPQSPVALVTGANRSIGLQIVRELAQRGMHVVLAARNPALGAQAAEGLAGEGLAVDVVYIDLDVPATHTEAFRTIRDRYGRLDVLVNNAAIIEQADGAAPDTQPDTVRRTLETNVIGTLSLTQTMLPLLRRSTSGRIINLSSALGSMTHAADPESEFSDVLLSGYAISKTALNMLTVQLAVALRPDGIAVNAVDPGFTATAMNGHQGYQSLAEGAAESVRLACLPESPTAGFYATGHLLPW